MICLCLSGDTLVAWGREFSQERSHVSMVELRIDLLRPIERDPQEISRWVSTLPEDIPVIITVRRTQDLGTYEGDEGQRRVLIEQIVAAVSQTHTRRWYVDIELDRRGSSQWDILAQTVRSAGGTVIRSHHQLHPPQESLSILMARLATEAREVPKLAVPVSSTAEMIAFVAAAQEFRQRMGGREAVWIAMGEYGIPSRAFPSFMGSSWTYATRQGTAPVAPGQLTPKVLHEQYRVGRTAAHTPVFAVIGSPINHSRSPELHNRWFQEAQQAAIYLPLRLDTFDLFPRLAETYALSGVSVTVPHKESALAFAQGADGGGATAEAIAVGAANTLVRTDTGQWHATNTDVAGFLFPLEQEHILPGTGQSIAVIGSGGAARAVVAALAPFGVDVHIFNRTTARGEALAQNFGIPTDQVHPLDDVAVAESRDWYLIVQTTSVGMDGETDPMPAFPFRGKEIVYDLIYNPEVTPFLRRAQEAGCRTINGSAMLRHQGELQWRMFSSRAAASAGTAHQGPS